MSKQIDTAAKSGSSLRSFWQAQEQNAQRAATTSSAGRVNVSGSASSSLLNSKQEKAQLKTSDATPSTSSLSSSSSSSLSGEQVAQSLALPAASAAHQAGTIPTPSSSSSSSSSSTSSNTSLLSASNKSSSSSGSSSVQQATQAVTAQVAPISATTKELTTTLSIKDVNEEFFYRSNDIVKIWEQYLKAYGDGIKFYTGVEAREGEMVTSLFNGLSQTKETAIIINKDGTPYHNKDGQTITLCGEINYIDLSVSESSASSSASSSSSIGRGVQGISQRMQEVIEQIKAYNDNPANIAKITNHIVLFPYHVGPVHWNLGQIELRLNSQDSTLIEATINIYEPFGGKASGYNGLIASINQLDAFKLVKIKPKKTDEPHIRQQHDSTSCGAITAENGKELLKSQRYPSGKAA